MSKQLTDLWKDAPEVFPNRKAVAKFVSQRFDRSMRSVERDLATKNQGVKQEPKCFPRSDGQGYDLTEVQRYTRAEELELRPEYGGEENIDGADINELKRKKLAEEARKVKVQADRQELDLAVEQGKLVPAESRDKMLAQRLRLLKQGLKIELKQAAPDLLRAVGGEEDLLPNFKAALLELAESIFAKWYEQGVDNDGEVELNEPGTGSNQAENS